MYKKILLKYASSVFRTMLDGLRSRHRMSVKINYARFQTATIAAVIDCCICTKASDETVLILFDSIRIAKRNYGKKGRCQSPLRIFRKKVERREAKGGTELWALLSEPDAPLLLGVRTLKSISKYRV